VLLIFLETPIGQAFVGNTHRPVFDDKETTSQISAAKRHHYVSKQMDLINMSKRPALF
jgi:hypothetical protein